MGPHGPTWAHMGPYGPTWAHIWAHKGPYGPIYGPICAHMGPYMGPYVEASLLDLLWKPAVDPLSGWGPYGPLWVLLDRSWKFRKLSVRFPSTFRTTIWTNFIHFGSRNCILMKFLDDSASFLLEKLKNHVILTQNLNIQPKIQKIPEKSRKFPEIPRNS